MKMFPALIGTPRHSGAKLLLFFASFHKTRRSFDKFLVGEAHSNMTSGSLMRAWC